MHTPRRGPDFGRRHTREHRVRECARDLTTGREKSGPGGMRLGGAREHARYGVRDIVDAGAAQALLIEGGHGCVERAASVFAGGGRATHLGDEAVEPVGNRVARPGLRYRDAETVDPVQREGARYALMVRGVYGQHSQHLARAQANTAIDQPEQAVAQGGLAQRHALKQAGRWGADHRQARHPIDHSLRTRCLLDAQRPREETQDACDGTTADARHSKEVEAYQPHLHRGRGDRSVPVGVALTQWGFALLSPRLGRLKGLGGAVSLGAEERGLCALVSLSISSWRGWVFPLLSTVCDCGELPHGVRARQPPWLQAMGVSRVERKRPP